MNYCVDCGLPIPDGQHTCSMCYGDPWHGRDGYYMAELKREWCAKETTEEAAARLEEDRRRVGMYLPDEQYRTISWEAYQDGRYNCFGVLDAPEPTEWEAIPLGEQRAGFGDDQITRLEDIPY